MVLPAIVGAAQVLQRPGLRDLVDAHGPIELMVEAAQAAAADAAASTLLKRVDWIGVAGGWFRFRNPGQLVAERIGAPGAGTAITAISGTGPQDLVGVAAERIARGEIGAALVLGGEARWSAQRLKRAGKQPGWITDPGEGDPEQYSGFPDDLLEEVRFFGSAAAAYALFEDSLRVVHGDSVERHRDRIASLWAQFSKVAATNPHAWDREAKSAAAIREPSANNRMIAFPYTKAMVANNTVDMASALLLCSVDMARSAGVPDDRLVFPHVVTSSHETWKVVNRDELRSCPALTAAGQMAFERVGIGPDEVTHVDLYACFPAIVEMSAAALGFSPERPLSVTGGLGFAGAPVGNAVGHSIATMVPLVRQGGWGLIHGNGGNATKHSFAIYANEPPASFAYLDSQPRVDQRGRAELESGWSGRVTVEAATVVFDREGPSHVLAAVRAHDQRRGWAIGRDEALMSETMAAGLVGLSGERSGDGTFQA